MLFDRDPNILQHKLAVQLARWEAKWARTSNADARRQQVADGKAEAEQATRNTQKALAETRGLLVQTLSVNDRMDWETLKDKRPFAHAPLGTLGSEYAPSGRRLRFASTLLASQPITTDFTPKFGIINAVFPWIRSTIVTKADATSPASGPLAGATTVTVGPGPPRRHEPSRYPPPERQGGAQRAAGTQVASPCQTR